MPGGIGNFTTIEPISPDAVGCPPSSRTCTSQLGTAGPEEPAFTANSSIPVQLAAIGQPVSVCHQWSMVGTPSLSSHQCSVSGSHRSPARNWNLKWERSNCWISLPSGSSFLIALIAVGAVNIVRTLCSDITRQKVEASGVPTGLPSNNTVVQPAKSGA